MIEIGVLVIVILAVVAIYILFKALKHLIINSILGILVLFLANLVFQFNIAYSWLVIAICAIGGLLGAGLVIALHIAGIAF